VAFARGPLGTHFDLHGRDHRQITIVCFCPPPHDLFCSVSFVGVMMPSRHQVLVPIPVSFRFETASGRAPRRHRQGLPPGLVRVHQPAAPPRRRQTAAVLIGMQHVHCRRADLPPSRLPGLGVRPARAEAGSDADCHARRGCLRAPSLSRPCGIVLWDEERGSTRPMWQL
jgi:hypothetical protein